MGKRGNGVLSGTLYLPSLSAEGDVIKAVEGKFKDFQKVFQMTHTFREALCETSSSTQLKTIPNNTVDYIFTDPPLGTI